MKDMIDKWYTWAAGVAGLVMILWKLPSIYKSLKHIEIIPQCQEKFNRYDDDVREFKKFMKDSQEMRRDTIQAIKDNHREVMNAISKINGDKHGRSDYA